MKKRRNFPDMAWISCKNRQDAPLDNPKEPCYHDSILKKAWKRTLSGKNFREMLS